MRQKCRTVLLVFVILFIFLSKVVAGGSVMWQEGGVPVGSSISYTFGRHVIVSDMKGGAIVGWSEGRDPHNGVYAQRVDSSGNVLWQDNGTPVCTTGFFFDPYNLCAVSDGYGGAIFVWEDMRYEYDLYAQRIDSSGNVLWNPAGVAVCDYDSVQENPSIVSDGAGGCIVAWEDCRHGGFTNRDIYSQRLSSSGNRLWLIDGVAVCTASGHQYLNHYYPCITSDGLNGAVISWEDDRAGDGQIYAQRISSVGVQQWGFNGSPICTLYSGRPSIINVNNNFIISWRVVINNNVDVYAQKVGFDGITQWIDNGIPVCDIDSIQGGQSIVTDNNNGVIIKWWDYRNGNWDIFAQRVDSTGSLLWDSVGVAVCEADSDQEYHKMVRDEKSGAIIAWKDERGFYDGIYVQHIDSSGICLWDSNGMFISSNTADVGLPVIVEDGVGGAIIAWSDGRPKGIYAQRVGDVAGIQEKRDHRQKNEEQRLLLCYPNPFSHSTTIRYAVNKHWTMDNNKFENRIQAVISLEVYDLSGRLVKTLVSESKISGVYSVEWDGKMSDGTLINQGIYFCVLSSSKNKVYKVTKKIIFLK